MARIFTSEDVIVVTGGAGFIGCNFVRHALEHSPARVVVFDKLTYAGSLDNLTDVSDEERFRFVRGDIARRSDVEALFEAHSPTAIVNFAAESHVDRSIDDPATFIVTNVNGTFELLDASRRHLDSAAETLAERFRFLHVSTDEVFGSLGADGLFSETTAYDPSSPYSASKASADHLVRAYARTFGLPTLVTNCSNNYGPFQFPEKLIPVMALNALEAKPLPIYGDGSNVRDWLHVEDHCSGILLALEKGCPGESYNIGGNNERTNLEVVDAICAVLEEIAPAAENTTLREKGLSSYVDLKTYVADRPGHDQRYAIDSTKIRRELGWQPSYDFESGLAQTLRWYLDNRSWCETVQKGQQRARIGLGKGSSEETGSTNDDQGAA